MRFASVYHSIEISLMFGGTVLVKGHWTPHLTEALLGIMKQNLILKKLKPIICYLLSLQKNIGNFEVNL